MEQIRIIKTDEKVNIKTIKDDLIFLIEGDSINEKLMEDLEQSNNTVLSCTDKINNFKQLIFDENISISDTLNRIINTTSKPALVNLGIPDFQSFFTKNYLFNVIRNHADHNSENAMILMNCPDNTTMDDITKVGSKISKDFKGRVLWGVEINDSKNKIDKIIITGKEKIIETPKTSFVKDKIKGSKFTPLNLDRIKSFLKIEHFLCMKNRTKIENSQLVRLKRIYTKEFEGIYKELYPENYEKYIKNENKQKKENEEQQEKWLKEVRMENKENLAVWKKLGGIE